MKFIYLASILIFLQSCYTKAQEECQDPKTQPCFQNTIEVPCKNGKVRCKFPEAFPTIPVNTKVDPEVANSILNLIRKEDSTVRLFSEVASCSDVSDNTPYGNEAPTNIPYCLRIPCDTINSKVHTNKAECHMEPGCYYDDELGYLRLAYGEDLLRGVPVCHQVIRNTEFLSRAKRIQRRFAWNSYLTSCLFDKNSKTIFDPNLKCNMISLMKYFGFHPKFAGWKNINKMECKIFGACWMKDSGCYFGVNNNGFTVASEQLEDDKEVPLYGRAKCQEFNTKTPMDTVISFHKCLMAGCSLDKNIDEQYFSFIWLVGNTTSPQVHKALMNEVNAGTVAPNNLESFLEKQKKSINNYITPFAYNIPFNQSGLISSALDQGILNLLGLNQPFTAPADLGSSLTNIGNMLAGTKLVFSNTETSPQPTTTTTEATSTSTNPPTEQPTIDNSGIVFSEWLQAATGGESTSSEGHSNSNSNLGSFPPPQNDDDLGINYNVIESLKHEFNGFGFIGGCGFGLGRPCPPANFHPNPDVVVSNQICPFTKPNIAAPFPQLKGSFEGCCDVNLCFQKSTNDPEATSSGASWYYTQWTSWSDCSETCGEGIKKRWRNCISQENRNCKKNVDDVAICMDRECTVWEAWESWEACSVTCGGGVARRKRVCGPNIGTSVCGNEDMTMERQTKLCATEYCVEKYLSWEGWHGTCTPCGTKRERIRKCISHINCETDIETEICKQKCGVWNEFGEYTNCRFVDEFQSCFVSRYRTCQGEACKGEAEEHFPCACPS